MKISELLEGRRDPVKKPESNPKYLGPTEKVHINKRGWQIPLNKRGFGA